MVPSRHCEGAAIPLATTNPTPISKHTPTETHTPAMSSLDSAYLGAVLAEYVAVFAVLLPIGCGALGGVSIYQFRQMYLQPTYETWRLKYNREYPSVEAVTKEIVFLAWSTVATQALLAVSVQLGLNGYNGLFWQNSPESDAFSVWVNLRNFALAFSAVDLYSYLYHWAGHRYAVCWDVHRWHHKFFNPTPFGVIADDCLDQVLRAMPLLFLPLVIPTLNVAVLGLVFAFDLWYGILLHGGHENLTARHIADACERVAGTDVINTPLNHFLHHAISGRSSPVYCGFYVTCWDKLFRTENKAALQRYLDDIYTHDKRGAVTGFVRTQRDFDILKAQGKIPDYSTLGTLAHWRATDVFGTK